MWATTEVRPRGKQSPLSEDASKAKDWLGSIPSLDDMFTLKSYEELEKLVNDWLNGDSDDNNAGHTTRGGSEVQDTTDASANTAKYRSLDEAFADLETL